MRLWMGGCWLGEVGRRLRKGDSLGRAAAWGRWTTTSSFCVAAGGGRSAGCWAGRQPALCFHERIRPQ